jgi:hypothetical protein
LGGRRFLAMVRINLLSLCAHLCKQAVERGEHLLVIEGNGALVGVRFGVRLRSGTVLESTVAGIELVTSRRGGLPRWAVMTANVFGRSPHGREAASAWLMGD